MKLETSLFVLVVFLSVTFASAQYFDPHNHIGGVLPWRSYVNLSAFVENRTTVNFTTALQLWRFLNQTFHSAVPTDPKSTYPICLPVGGCIGAGTRATLALFQNISEFEANPEILYGVLERLLSTTPFTEFQSGYTIRDPLSDMSGGYMKQFYNGDVVKGEKYWCKGILSQLQHANVTGSELSFGANWNFQHQCLLDCLISNPGRGYKGLLFTWSNRLAYYNSTHYLTFQNSSNNSCAPTTLFNPPKGVPIDLKAAADSQIAAFQAYLNPDMANATGNGNPCLDRLKTEDDQAKWDVLVGVDLAGPEIICFTDSGMEFVRYISEGLMAESKRRATVSGGKFNRPMVFHIHVGEGFSVYYGTKPISVLNATFANFFGKLPGDHRTLNVITNPTVAENNIATLLNGIMKILAQNQELAKYVIYRFAHVTHLTKDIALKMSSLSRLYPGVIEADINIESNLATGAFALAPTLPIKTLLKPYFESRSLNFKLNDLSRILVPDPRNVTQVGAVYGLFDALKYLLMLNTPEVLPVMLGTDGTGMEHSPMIRAHLLAQSLISYWNLTSPEFRQANVTADYFDKSVEYHLKRMAGSVIEKYLEASTTICTSVPL